MLLSCKTKINTAHIVGGTPEATDVLTAMFQAFGIKVVTCKPMLPRKKNKPRQKKK